MKRPERTRKGVCEEKDDTGDKNIEEQTPRQSLIQIFHPGPADALREALSRLVEQEPDPNPQPHSDAGAHEVGPAFFAVVGGEQRFLGVDVLREVRCAPHPLFAKLAVLCIGMCLHPGSPDFHIRFGGVDVELHPLTMIVGGNPTGDFPALLAQIREDQSLRT